jgi:integrase
VISRSRAAAVVTFSPSCPLQRMSEDSPYGWKHRNGHRDGTMLLMAFRHGLRASEVCDLRWDQVDFARAAVHVRRAKNGTPSTHPLTGRQMRALRRLQREAPSSPFMFVSERGAPFTTAGLARMMERAAESAGLDIKAHPHMLGHACGYALANRVSIQEGCKPISGIGTYSTPCATPNCRPTGSRVGGKTNVSIFPISRLVAPLLGLDRPTKVGLQSRWKYGGTF